MSLAPGTPFEPRKPLDSESSIERRVITALQQSSYERTAQGISSLGGCTLVVKDYRATHRAGQ